MKKLLMFLLFVTLASCMGRKTELPILDLAAAMNTGPQLSDSFTLNDIVEVVGIIPIETRPATLVGELSLEHIGKDYYYLTDIDQNAILRIDRNGKIVGTIARQSRGPGEYLRITVVDVDEGASTIRVFDQQNNKYITYDMEGTLINEGLLSEKGIGLPRFIADDYMVVQGRQEGSHQFYITDRNMNILQGFFPLDTTALNGIERLVLTQMVAVGPDGSAALVNQAKEDTLYRVTKQGVTPEAILRKGQYRLPKEAVIPILSPDSPPYFTSTIVNSSSDYYFINILALGRIMEIWRKSDSRLIAYTDSRNDSDNFGFRFILPSGRTTRVSSFHIDGDTIGFLINAIDIIGEIGGIQEDDNPVVVIATLK